MNWRDPDWLLGRRYVSDLTILSIRDDPARTVKLLINGQRGEISFAELMAAIESGFIQEYPLACDVCNDDPLADGSVCHGCGRVGSEQ